MITKRDVTGLEEKIKSLEERIQVLEKKLDFVSMEKVDKANEKKRKWLNGDPVDSEVSKRGIIR